MNSAEMPLQITMTVHIKPDIQAINIWSTESNPYHHYYYLNFKILNKKK